ncbi:phosphoribosylformylglycinamidine cyclo-ligase [Mariprofundus ferrinatatus]|uniref:Phosphoribosylformylglycinamidine cyclo-ligase n=1 Tax=Mariprofundus ferrinatatus TaxID=1921087 RepID=A0A2K8L0P7_9PROT|nr:phosphoribosylformylglycinamidine cyclo-ligase [Mariprofundus ferrinatatus]ATX80885.1 phosphoribosylformylglycinamidine cyclo-ligase [Mariprofundus ferrinatatus]
MSATEKSKLSYADCGVDIDAGNAFVGRIKQAVNSTMRPEVLSGLGGFGGLFKPDFKGMQEPVLVSGTDGVGTKLLLLQEYDLPHVAGIDAVAMCVNDLAALGADPLFFLDYLATGKLAGETLAGVVEGIADACRTCECALVGGETAEMPGMYAPGHYDIGGFCVGVVDRPKMVDGSKISAGDVIVGVASNGPHSNGFSMVRKLLELGDADLNSDTLSDGRKAIEGVLSPTRLYVPAVNALMKSDTEIHGFSHITGGGMFDNFERLLSEDLAVTIDVSSWPVPPAFEYLLSFADVERDERYRTFNMGIGFAVILPESEAGKAEAVLNAAGETTFRIGSVHKRSGEPVTLIG